MWLHYIWYRIKIRYQINTVPTPTVGWTRAWLLQRGGGVWEATCHTPHPWRAIAGRPHGHVDLALQPPPTGRRLPRDVGPTTHLGTHPRNPPQAPPTPYHQRHHTTPPHAPSGRHNIPPNTNLATWDHDTARDRGQNLRDMFRRYTPTTEGDNVLPPDRTSPRPVLLIMLEARHFYHVRIIPRPETGTWRRLTP